MNINHEEIINNYLVGLKEFRRKHYSRVYKNILSFGDSIIPFKIEDFEKHIKSLGFELYELKNN